MNAAWWCLPVHHPLASTSSISLGDFAIEPLVTITRSTWPGFYDELIGLCHGFGFSPVIHEEAIELQTVFGLVAAGVGVAVVPASAANLHARHVVFRTLEGGAPAVEMAVAWRTDTPRTVDAFLQVVRTICDV